MKDGAKKARRPDPRIAQTRKVVLEATFQLIAELGFSGVTIEKIAERSDTARSTIYRHWPDPTRLYIEAFEPLTEPGTDVTGETFADLKEWLDHAVRRFNDPLFVAALIALIDQTSRESEYADLHRAFMAKRIAVVKKIVRSGIEKGDVRAGSDPDFVVEKLLSPLIYSRLILHAPIDDNLHDRIYRDVVDYLVPTGHTATGASPKELS